LSFVFWGVNNPDMPVMTSLTAGVMFVPAT